MMRKKTIYAIISLLTIVVLIVGMIIATVLLSKNNKPDWEYISSNEKIDYISTDIGYQHSSNFKESITNYFGSLLNDNLSSFIGTEAEFKSLLGFFADKVLNAMASARISSQKLNRIAKAMDNNSIESVFGRFKSWLVQFESLEDMEAELTEKLKDISFIGIISGLLDGIMDETTLTENEIANFLYYFLAQNTATKYTSYLNLIGEEYLSTIFSNTIYALKTFKDINSSKYLLTSTAYSLQASLYQLGSLYANIASLPNGTVLLERVLWLTWDFDENYKNSDYLNEIADTFRGKIGELIASMGVFMRELTVEDIISYLDFSSETDELLKADKKIDVSIRFSKAINRTLPKINIIINEDYDTVINMLDCYREININVCNLSYEIMNEIFEGEIEEDTSSEENQLFTDFGNSLTILCGKEYTLSDISSMDKDSEGYKFLSEISNKFYSGVECIPVIFGNIFSVWISNGVFNIVQTGGLNE